MPETRVVIGRITSSERTDALVALALGICVLGYQAATGALPRSAWTIPILVLLSCGAIVVRRRRPFTASVAMTAGLVLVWASGQEHALTGATNLLLVVPPLLTYTLGTNAGLGTGLAGATLLAAGLQLGGPFNPLVEMITFGPLLAGRVVRSRRQLIEQIEIRNRELEAERALFAQESVRYERARIARELHDIVGHSISVVVLQAAAAQRYAGSAPNQTAGALDAIVEAAREALNGDRPPQPRTRPSSLSGVAAGSTSSPVAPPPTGCRCATGLPASLTHSARPRQTSPTASSKKASPTRSSTHPAQRSTSPCTNGTTTSRSR